MRISSIIDIVGGKLLNSPAISFVTQFHTDITKVNEGDLFFAQEKSEIKLAISNGAFAILVDFNVKIIDNEIAWIRVEDITLAQIKLLRFIFSNKEIKSFYCDDVVFELFNLYSYIDKNLVLLTNNISNDFELLKDIPNSTSLISNNKKFIKDIQPLSKNLYKENQHITNLTQHSIFYTTFSYQNILYSRIRLPSIYINNFLLVQDFFCLPLDISRLKNFKYFNPIFVNKHLEIVDFGKSNKFILANENKNIINNELKFLTTNYSYAKIIVIDKYKNDTDLFNQIKTRDFNALYIKGKSQYEINEILKENQRELSKLI